MLSTLIDDGANDTDVEAEVCRQMGFDPVTYALAEELTESSAANDPEESQF
jgi:hypothetical protein